MSKRPQQSIEDLAKAAENMSKTPEEFVGKATEDPIAKAEAKRQEDDLQTKLKATYEAQQAAKQEPAKQEPAKQVSISGGADVQQKTVDRPANAAGKTSAPPTSQAQVKRGRIFKPRRTVIYGEGGCGKTTLISDIEGVLLFDLNNGSEMLDIPRYDFRPRDENRGHVPDTLREFIGGVRNVATDRERFGWVKAVAVDLLTDLELLAIKHIVERDNPQDGKAKTKTSLEAYGYGAGRQVLFDQMRSVCAELDRLTTVGLSVFLIAHSEVTKFANPSGPDYAIHNIKAQDHKDCSVAGYIFGWADEVGFMHFDDTAAKVGGGKKGPIKGVTGGNRVIDFDHSATHKAKSRLPLPPRVQVGSANPARFLKDAIHRAYRMTPPEIRREIQEELTRISDPDLAVNVDKAVANVGDNLDKLTAFLQELRRRPAVVSDDEAGQAGTDDPI